MPPVCSAMASARWPCLILALLSGVAVSGFPRRLCRLLGVNLPPLHHLAGRGARPAVLCVGCGGGRGWAVSCREQSWYAGNWAPDLLPNPGQGS